MDPCQRLYSLKTSFLSESKIKSIFVSDSKWFFGKVDLSEVVSLSTRALLFTLCWVQNCFQFSCIFHDRWYQTTLALVKVSLTINWKTKVIDNQNSDSWVVMVFNLREFLLKFSFHLYDNNLLLNIINVTNKFELK